MISRDILPSHLLQGLISHYRLRHFVFGDGVVPAAKPFPPRPEQCLTFYLRGEETSKHLNEGLEFRKPRSVISGQFTYRIDRYVSYPEFLMIIVDFKPGALHRLTGIPFTEFANKELDAECVFPPEIRQVNDRLSGAQSYHEMIEIIEFFFTELTLKSKKEILALDHMLTFVTQEPDYSIDRLARNSYLSLRQLERKFAERIGINPKTFLRIARFNQSYWLHLRKPGLSWFDIAMTCGYTDYHHLVRDYKEFAGTTPNNFFAAESKAPGRILGLTK